MTRPRPTGGRALPIGTRVRLRSPSWGLTPRVDTGTVIRVHTYDGYYVIRLDQPALYDHGIGLGDEELIEVVEAADNMDVLPEPRERMSDLTLCGCSVDDDCQHDPCIDHADREHRPSCYCGPDCQDADCHCLCDGHPMNPERSAP